ncbi:MAG: Maf family protein [Gammaproteobacteria bacterium]
MSARPALALASRSPRRAALLRLLGVEFDILPADADESTLPGEHPADYARRVARLKAGAARAGDSAGRVLLAADTCVSIDGSIFGKPAGAADCARMLRRLAGRWHDVHTAVVVAPPSGAAFETVVTTRVEFVAFDDAVIRAYWASGEPTDKAGAYGIQGLGGALVSRIEGSYSAVVGLPLAETATLLGRAGVAHALTG